MKKLLVLFLVVFALAFVYGCGDKEEAAQPGTATETPAATDEATEAGSEAVENVEAAVEADAAVDLADPFANQAPITQADVDAYIKAIPQITASMGDEAKLREIYEEAGWDEWRGAYVLSKVGTAYAISAAPEQAEMMIGQLPASLKPSQDEIDLVAKAQDEITKAITGQ